MLGALAAFSIFIAEVLYGSLTRTPVQECKRAPKHISFTMKLAWSPEVSCFYYVWHVQKLAMQVEDEIVHLMSSMHGAHQVQIRDIQYQ